MPELNNWSTGVGPRETGVAGGDMLGANFGVLLG